MTLKDEKIISLENLADFWKEAKKHNVFVGKTQDEIDEAIASNKIVPGQPIICLAGEDIPVVVTEMANPATDLDDIFGGN